MIINNDGIIRIAVGESRKSLEWKNKRIKWSVFLEKLSKVNYTDETQEEYFYLKKSDQDNIKDVGGFVGGVLEGGKRRKDTVKSRFLITLDADYLKEDIFKNLLEKLDFAFCIYSTHKHKKSRPRLRIVIPLKNEVNPDEYEAISRLIAKDINIDYFDDTTYEPSRLMYWPSTSCDGDYIFKYKDSKWLDPNDILNRYGNYEDTSLWPVSSRTIKHINVLKNNHKNLNRPFMVDVFCKTYNVEEAIKKFLPDVYEHSVDNRYTYLKGSSSSGLVIYDKSEFAYSFHSTDPSSGRLCNSFDLVRIHKFENGEKVSRQEAYNKMIKFIGKDEKFKENLAKERLNTTIKDFDINKDTKNNEWISNLDIDNKGNLKATVDNLLLILKNDLNLKNCIGYNEFSNRTTLLKDLPWHKLKDKNRGDSWEDSDDAALRHYIERNYNIYVTNKVNDALLIIEKENSFHPIRDYLKNLKYDGIKRLEKIFVDYLGAISSKYVKAVTKKTFVASVARIFEPGIKFDNMLVLVGKQGIGKSHIINLIGQDWYSDSLNTVQGKEAYEQLQDAWIIEMAELSATKYAEVESVKHFISKKEDIYRVAYGKRVNKFKRQCVFFGTTNDFEFLKDKTGNRRFWPVEVGKMTARKNLWKDLTQNEIDNIWAEAYFYYKQGEKVTLNFEMEEQALKAQENHMEESAKKGLIIEYLNMLLPENWNDFDLGKRRNFIKENIYSRNEIGTLKRDRVCAVEIWSELLEGEIRNLKSKDAREINDILRSLKEWKVYEINSGRLRFGKIYGVQKAFVRKDFIEQ